MAILLLASAGCLIVVSAASAKCGSGPKNQVVVARGESPGGAKWRVTAKRSRDHYADFSFVFGGVGEVLGVSAPQDFLNQLADVVPLADIGPARETGVVGILPRRVATVEIHADDQPALPSTPITPAPAVARRICWLNDVRFLEAFLPRDSEVVRVVGFDTRGGKVFQARAHKHGGLYRLR